MKAPDREGEVQLETLNVETDSSDRLEGTDIESPVPPTVSVVGFSALHCIH